MHYFGSDIYRTANEVKLKVTNVINPLYIPPEDLKSGETPTAMLLALRKAIYSPEALAKAKRSVQAKHSRMNAANTVPPDWNEEEEVKKKFLEYLEGYEREEWFPSYWLSFVLLSLPAGDRCLGSFQTGSASKVQSDYISAQQAERQRTRVGQGRSERRLADKIAAGASLEKGIRAASPSTPVIEHVIIFAGHKRGHPDEEEQALKLKRENFMFLTQKYDFYKRIGKDEEADKILQEIYDST